MSPETNLPPGYTSVEKACEIIKSDTRENPIVDMDYLISHTVWIETNHGFRIPKIRRLKPEEVKRNRRGIIKEYENIGEINVKIDTNYQKELLKKTIFDKYKELVGHEYRQVLVHARSTVADDAQGKAAVQPRNNTKPIAKEGAVISSGEIISSNGEGLSV